MIKKSAKQSRASQNSQAPSANNTVYYSFDASLEASMRMSTTFGRESQGENGAFTGNILSQLNESSGNRPSSSGNQGLNEEEIERTQSIGLRLSKVRNTEHPFNAISEENEEHEEESFMNHNNTNEKTQRVSLIEGRISKNESQLSRSSVFLKGSLKGTDQVAEQDGLELDAKRREWIEEAEGWISLLQSINEKGLEGYDKICDEKRCAHMLKVYLNNYENKAGNKINRTVSEWIVPFKAEQYIKFMSNFEEQKVLDKNMDIYKHLETFADTEEKWYSVYYIAYKKVLIASPRDFVYMKHVKKIEENTWCDVSKSIDHEEYPEFKDKVRGDILLSGSIVTEYTDPATGKTHSRVRLYSENNFKLNIPTFLAKSFAGGEMKKFIELVINRMSQLHPENL